MDSIAVNVLLKKWLKAHAEIEIAILFGSYATGRATMGSDVDLAIQLTSGQCMLAEEKLGYINQLTELLNVSIDLVDLRSVGQPLLAQVMKYGQLLVGPKARYAQLAIHNVNSSQDFIPYIERMLTERRKRWLSDG